MLIMVIGAIPIVGRLVGGFLLRGASIAAKTGKVVGTGMQMLDNPESLMSMSRRNGGRRKFQAARPWAPLSMSPKKKRQSRGKRRKERRRKQRKSKIRRRTREEQQNENFCHISENLANISETVSHNLNTLHDVNETVSEIPAAYDAPNGMEWFWQYGKLNLRNKTTQDDFHEEMIE